MSPDEDEISEVDRADSAETEPYDPDAREAFTDEREEPLEDEDSEAGDEPDLRGDEPPRVD